MRNLRGTLLAPVALLIFQLCYIPATHGAGIDLGLCEPVHITCSCGSSGVVQVQIPACTWFYRWRPYCKACDPDIDETALCAQYRNCLECSTTRGQGCTRCPPGRVGKQCNEDPAQSNAPRTTPAPTPGDYCDAFGNRYVPVDGCRRFEQYVIDRSLTVPAGTLPCPAGLLFDTSVCSCNFDAEVTCAGGGVNPPSCDIPANDSLLNGSVTVTSSTDPLTIRYNCNEGFRLEGVVTNECVNGEWTSSPPRCVAIPVRPVRCEVPQLPPRASIIVEGSQTSFPVGTTVRVGCEQGYKVIGSRDIVCTPSGTWQIEEPIACTRDIAYCEDPGIPKNGVRRVVDPRSATIRRLYNPLRRSRLFHSTQRVQGRRSRLGRDVRSPTARVPPGYFPPDTRLLFSCENRHYNLVGSRSRYCRSNGLFTGRQPACIPACGKSGASRTAFITNGNATRKGQWPWQVALSRNDLNLERSFKLVCGGALLNEHWVVTAAHCVTDPDTGSIVPNNHFKIHLGRHYRDMAVNDESVQEFNVTVISVHENFIVHTLESDIALLKLSGTGARFSDRVRPVCLSSSEEESIVRLRPGNQGIVTGWGTTEHGVNAASLRQAYIPVIDSEECEDSYTELGYNVPVTSQMYCAGFRDGGIDACNGDSGGPMVFSEGSGDARRWILEGLVSWGSPSQRCGSPQEYGGYTKVAKFLDWIREVISY